MPDDLLPPGTAQPDLETLILNRLQDRKRGQTLEQLAEFLQAPQGVVRAVLEQSRQRGAVFFADGAWHLDTRSFDVPDRPQLKQIAAGIYQCSRCDVKFEMTPASLSHKNWRQRLENDYALHVAQEHPEKSSE
jgi:hypothetical protein